MLELSIQHIFMLKQTSLRRENKHRRSQIVPSIGEIRKNQGILRPILTPRFYFYLLRSLRFGLYWILRSFFITFIRRNFLQFLFGLSPCNFVGDFSSRSIFLDDKPGSGVLYSHFFGSISNWLVFFQHHSDKILSSLNRKYVLWLIF